MSPASSLSIAMCTFNGARHVLEQLESIAAQTRAPYEVVICDDRSDDATADILRTFSAESGLPIRLHLNPERLGWTKNFERAISLCRGDVIVLADQDDVWRPDKLARLEAVFCQTANVGAAMSDADVVDDRLQPLGYTLWQALRFSGFERERAGRGELLEVLLKRNVAAGATMAFRRTFTDLVLPIPHEWRLDAHDAWIALLIAAVAPVALIDEPLIQYRQHGGQQIGGRTQTIGGMLGGAFEELSSDFGGYSAAKRENCAAALARFVLAQERLLQRSALAADGREMSQLRAKIDHFRARSELPGGRWARLPIVAREFLARRYHRYSRGLLSAANDLVR